jgi:hypothetical protein
MNVLGATAAGVALLVFGAGAALADSTAGPLLTRAPDPCCVVVSVGPGGRAVIVESTATRHRWMYYLTGAQMTPALLGVGSRVDFDPLTGRLFDTDHEFIAGALVSVAN